MFVMIHFVWQVYGADLQIHVYYYSTCLYDTALYCVLLHKCILDHINVNNMIQYIHSSSVYYIYICTIIAVIWCVYVVLTITCISCTSLLACVFAECPPLPPSVEPMPSQCGHLSSLRIPKSTWQMCPTLPDIFHSKVSGSWTTWPGCGARCPAADGETPGQREISFGYLHCESWRSWNGLLYYTCDSPLWMALVLFVGRCMMTVVDCEMI